MLDKYNKTIAFYTLSLVIPWILWFIVAYFSHLPEQNNTLSIIEQLLGSAGLIAPLVADRKRTKFLQVCVYSVFVIAPLVADQ